MRIFPAVTTVLPNERTQVIPPKTKTTIQTTTCADLVIPNNDRRLSSTSQNRKTQRPSPTSERRPSPSPPCYVNSICSHGLRLPDKRHQTRLRFIPTTSTPSSNSARASVPIVLCFLLFCRRAVTITHCYPARVLAGAGPSY